jgi:hypothetical protein
MQSDIVVSYAHSPLPSAVDQVTSRARVKIPKAVRCQFYSIMTLQKKNSTQKSHSRS